MLFDYASEQWPEAWNVTHCTRLLAACVRVCACVCKHSCGGYVNGENVALRCGGRGRGREAMLLIEICAIHGINIYVSTHVHAPKIRGQRKYISTFAK